MPEANFKDAHKTFRHLRSKPELLEELDVALTKFRHHLDKDVDDATFTYVVNALLNQKVTDGKDRFGGDRGVTKFPGGFRILAAINVEKGS